MHRCVLMTLFALTASAAVAAGPSSRQTAARVDQLILVSEESKVTTIDDATFLRRVSLDILGRPATPGETTRFGLDPTPNKRTALIDRLLESEEYGETWARYWAETILLRATNERYGLVREPFEQWMSESLNDNRRWDDIVTDLLTASGSVREEGSTALFFAHEGTPEEVAAEASRLFLGIQVQCANCHDHPWDRWKRDEFHELVAFFPRVSVRRDPQSDDRRDFVVASVNQERRQRRGVSQFLLTRLDRNKDQIITKQEAARSPLQRLFNNDRIMERVDGNSDGKLSLEEIKNAQPADNNRPGRGSAEHFMPDLDNPASEGTKIDPVFFLNNRKITPGSDDAKRRNAAAGFITSRSNEWFSRSIVNRMWTELTGTAFYQPVDDIGPDRTAQHEDALVELASAFVKNGHDLKWLMRTITSTRIYQRSRNADVDGFAYQQPSRLRADQLYEVLCQSLGVGDLVLPATDRRRYGRSDPGRAEISSTFGFDPSVPREDITGRIPQALFLMNSPIINQLIHADGPGSPLDRIRQTVPSDKEVIPELYLSLLGREPTAGEIRICESYLDETSDSSEALEDIFWALLNSSEFQTKR